MTKFLSVELWETIKLLSASSKKTQVAVAYFGTGGANLLTLKKSDILLVAMHLNNVKAGQVNPFEIEKLYKKGVLIFNLPNLHSKIYLFDKKVIIASANVSSNSKNTLIETGVLTDDSKIVLQAAKFIKEHCVEKVEQDYIEVCKKNYSPPKFIVKGQQKTKSTKLNVAQFSRLWVISTKDSNADNEISIKEEKIFNKKIVNKRTFVTEKITYPPSDSFINKVHEGDILVQIYNRNLNSIVLEPTRAIGVAWNNSRTHKVLVIEERKESKTKGWKKLETILRKNKIKAITKNSTREIKNNNTKKLLLDFFASNS